MACHVPEGELTRVLLLEGADAAADGDFAAAFVRVAGILFNSCTVHVAGVPHALTEVEFYYDGSNHPDKFTHGDPLQLTHGQWYFHKHGGNYRAGTFKGLDITIGGPGVHGGVLVRGMQALTDPHTYLDGPCVCVDHILQLNNAASVEAFVQSLPSLAVEATPGKQHPLFMTYHPAQPRNSTFVASPRVGLTLKNFQATQRKELYIMRPYRFVSHPKLTKKGKQLIIVYLHKMGRTAEDIRQLTGATPPAIAKSIALYEKGMTQTYQAFIDVAVTNDSACELYGACSRFLTVNF
eukprot:TRINITY_DN3070_c0_g3_i12.p1 TRINITY_DN3070_c0_g3~~TRINITY_DN3070_c0_g3_i12.p1  ORF type:complete len:294 (+),score=57.46 TRINITY_DN3070_c0_g3_i12:51-932(+)